MGHWQKRRTQVEKQEGGRKKRAIPCSLWGINMETKCRMASLNLSTTGLTNSLLWGLSCAL